ncbi:ig-like domain-containing protein [Streptomyces sp. NPDC051563]|uniref:ig-like domain-containing protein n=1 Tax=Streptomyces sp. NPDC051563 TaxID=3365659 RepID=UPI0037880716
MTGAHTVVTSASDHYPAVSDLSVRSPAVAKEGTVMAGPASASGWANLAASANGSATLRVCDNEADGWGVRAYVRDKSSATTVLTGADGAFADGCGTFTAPATSLPSPIVKVCLYRAGEEKNCREPTIT